MVYSVSSALAGTAAGALVGFAGSLVPFEFRVATASMLALVAMILGGIELGGRRIGIPQCDRETPKRWLHRGAFRWAAQNGMVLGIGASTRLGFWLWYAIPAGAFLFASPDLGAVIYGTYGLVRGMAVWSIILCLPRLVSQDGTETWLLARNGSARLLAAGQLVILGVAAALAIGW
jgi:hypothetical protein